MKSHITSLIFLILLLGCKPKEELSPLAMMLPDETFERFLVEKTSTPAMKPVRKILKI